MNLSLKERHLYGAGAAACAVCCAAPIFTVLGIAGAAATVATFVELTLTRSGPDA